MARDDPPLIVNVFLSSPGDVPEERAAARDLLKAELQYDPLLRGKVMFDVTSWDDPAAPSPMLPTRTPQASVNRFLRRPGQCHIVVVILARRLGTPLDPATHTRADGSAFPSGTVWEFEDALNASPQPDILLYRREDAPRDPAVEQFFERFRNPDGSLSGYWSPYATPADFLRSLTNDVKYLLRERLDSADAKKFSASVDSTHAMVGRRRGRRDSSTAHPPSTDPKVRSLTAMNIFIRGTNTRTRPPAEHGRESANDPGAQASQDYQNLFVVEERRNSIPECVELSVSSTQGSSRTLFDLVAELRFGWPEFYVDPAPIRYGVNSATISLSMLNCEIAGPRLGDKFHPQIAAEGNDSWRIVGPIEDGMLRRRILGDDPLCTIKAMDAGEIRLELCLTCRQYNICYSCIEIDTPETTPTEARILELFYNKSLGFDIDLGIVTLSRLVVTV